MRIAVLVKQVPSSNEVFLDPVTHTIIRDGKKSVINPYDRFALEAALQIKDKLKAQVDVFSMGILGASAILKEALALGADRAILLSDKAFAGADTLATAYTLHLALLKMQNEGPKYDLVLCGKMAIDGDTAQIGPELAQFLSLNHISDVKEIAELKNNEITVKRLFDGETQSLKANFPLLLTIDKDINQPRLPNIKGVLEAYHKKIEILNSQDLKADLSRCGLKGSPTRVVKVEVPLREQKCQFIEGSTAKRVSYLHNLLQSITKEESRTSLKPVVLDSEKERLKAGKADQNTLQKLSLKQFLNVDESHQNKQIWVLGQLLSSSKLHSVTYELLQKAEALAEAAGYEVALILPTSKLDERIYEVAHLKGVHYIFAWDNRELNHSTERAFGSFVTYLAGQIKPEIILTGATDWGRSVAPRIAAALKTGLTADCTALAIKDGLLEQTRPAFGGNLMATILCPVSRPQMATVRPRVFGQETTDIKQESTCFTQEQNLNQKTKDLKYLIHCVYDFNSVTNIEYLSREVKKTDSSLASADILFVAGKGIGSKKDLQQMINLAHSYNAAWGVSRPLVDIGLAPQNRQIGQTGQTVAPKLLFSFGVSGAIQHLAGMGRSKTIVAVNHDPMAQIFEAAHYGCVTDCQELLKFWLSQR